MIRAVLRNQNGWKRRNCIEPAKERDLRRLTGSDSRRAIVRIRAEAAAAGHYERRRRLRRELLAQLPSIEISSRLFLTRISRPLVCIHADDNICAVVGMFGSGFPPRCGVTFPTHFFSANSLGSDLAYKLPFDWCSQFAGGCACRGLK